MTRRVAADAALPSEAPVWWALSPAWGLPLPAYRLVLQLQRGRLATLLALSPDGYSPTAWHAFRDTGPGNRLPGGGDRRTHPGPDYRVLPPAHIRFLFFVWARVGADLNVKALPPLETQPPLRSAENLPPFFCPTSVEIRRMG